MASAKAPLRFRSDGTFNLLQIADVHMGEDRKWEPWWDLKPKQDTETFAGLRVIMELEHVDLAVLSGDQLTGLNIDANATTYWDRLTSLLDEHSIPHTAILGNHDAEPFNERGHQSDPGAKTNRSALMRQDAALPYSHSQLGPESLWPATSVYVVDVLAADADADAPPAMQLFHLDSGGGGMAEGVAAAQVAWFNATIGARRAAHGSVPTLVFVHIPLPEFNGAWSAGHCFGQKDDDIADAPDHGLFAALDAAPEARDALALALAPLRNVSKVRAAPPQVKAVFVGHNHCNDFCCHFGSRNLSLCFGRHSGFGGYQCSEYVPGSRRLTVTRAADGDVAIHTHVRLVDGYSEHSGDL